MFMDSKQGLESTYAKKFSIMYFVMLYILPSVSEIGLFPIDRMWENQV